MNCSNNINSNHHLAIMRRRATMQMNVESTTLDNKKASQEINTGKESNKKIRHVKFADEVEVRIIDPITDPEVKKALHYTREDIWIFQKRLQIEVALRRQIKNAKALQLKMKGNKLYIDYLERKNTNGAKRPPPQEARLKSCGVEMPAKRRRIQASVEQDAI
jgi:hypothetical protein